MARDKFGVIKNSGDRFHVADFAGANPSLDFSESENAGVDALVFLGARHAFFQAFRKKNRHMFFEEAWGGEQIHQFAHSLRGVTGFLGELAVRALEESFAIVFSPCDQFPEELLGGVAILANHQDAAIGKDRQHDYRAWMRDQLARCLQACGFDNFVAPHGEDGARVNDLTAQHSRFSGRRLGFLFHAVSFAPVSRTMRCDAVRCDFTARWAERLPCLSLSGLHILATGLAMPINTVIVDDERPARDELAFLLKGFPEINVIAQGKNGLEAVALIKEHNPDLVFLDVQMPGLDGLGVIKKLIERKIPVPQIVFATAFENYAVQAFEVNAVDYVLKPFDKARIAKAVQRAKKLVDANTSPVERLETLVGQLGAGAAPPKTGQPVKLLVKSQARLFLVDAEDVIYASIQDGTITIFARDTEGVSNYRTIEELGGALDEDVFWRAHRSYLVNMNHIKEVVPWFKSSYMLKMNDKRQSEIPVSRAQTKRLREFLKL